ncbi:hypothetical protein RB598_002227 [Gaeumannomyces tritici]
MGGITFGSSVAIQSVLALVVLFLVSARFYLRLGIQRKRPETSDYFILVAWVCALVSSSGDVLLLSMRWDSALLMTFENYEGSTDEFVLYLKCAYVATFFFYSGFYLAKFAILSVYLQLFPRHLKAKRHLLYATIAYSVVGFIATILVLILSCLPVERNWSTIPEDVCSFIIATDIMWGIHFSSSVLRSTVFLLPFLILKGMKMKTSVKIGLYATFGLGFIDLAVGSCLRYVWIRWSITNVTLAALDLYCALDQYICLIIACLPPLRPYLRVLRLDGSTAASGTGGSGKAGGRAFSGATGSGQPQLSKASSYRHHRRQQSRLSAIPADVEAARLASIDGIDDGVDGGSRAGGYGYELKDVPQGAAAASRTTDGESMWSSSSLPDGPTRGVAGPLTRPGE